MVTIQSLIYKIFPREGVIGSVGLLLPSALFDDLSNTIILDSNNHVHESKETNNRYIDIKRNSATPTTVSIYTQPNSQGRIREHITFFHHDS